MELKSGVDEEVGGSRTELGERPDNEELFFGLLTLSRFVTKSDRYLPAIFLPYFFPSLISPVFLL